MVGQTERPNFQPRSKSTRVCRVCLLGIASATPICSSALGLDICLLVLTPFVASHALLVYHAITVNGDQRYTLLELLQQQRQHTWYAPILESWSCTVGIQI